jgi:ATP-binding cassette subfamily B protein
MKKISTLLKNALRLNKVAWKERKGLVFFTLVLAAISAVVPFGTSGINALLINHLTSNFGKGVVDQTLLILALSSAAFLFIPDIVAAFRSWVDKRFYIEINEFFHLFFLKKKGEIDIQSYEDPKFQDVLNKAEDRGVYPMSGFLYTEFDTLGDVLGVILGLSVLLVYDWRICLIVMVAIIPQFIVEIKYNNETWGIWDGDADTRRRFNNLTSHFEQKNWLIELKLFQNVKLFYEKLSTILRGFSLKQRKAENRKLGFEIGSSLFSGGIIGAVTFWIIVQVVQGKTEIGTMIFIVASIQQLQGALIRFLGSIARLHERNLYVEPIFNVLDTPSVLTRSSEPVLLDGVTPEIIFEDVSFSYPHKEVLTLEHINITIKPGEKFALVGENGAGKTTFVKLLCRIYDPTSGRILINGIDLKDIELESWYKTLGILFQEYAPYKFEVKETISFGRSDEAFDMERIQKAAEASESDSFIQEWPQKYDQMLGTEFDKGLDPSKGQQQRLAIARLFHRRAGVLILDEPTASIDAEAEKKIFDQMERETKGQTVILISHKFSTVKDADRICVFKDKTVHELGSHQELIAKKGTYAKLFQDQAEGYGIK